MTIAFLTLGCKLNYAETSTYEREFIKNGLSVVSWRDKADVYIINTCSVTATSDSKSRNLIRKVHRLAPEAIIVVTGCSAELRRSEIEAIEGVWRVFGAKEKAQLVPTVITSLQGSDEASLQGSDEASLQGSDEASLRAQRGNPSNNGIASHSFAMTEEVFAAYSTGERTRSFLKVQDGCSNFCKYCTVPFARGLSRNIPICECVKNAELIAKEGVKEIVLTGVNTGDFGKTTGESFLDLLKELHKVEGIERYRISSIEPNLLTNEIIDWIATEGTKFQAHFHIPLQTGCDTLLKSMGRKYDTALFEQKISYIRSRLESEGKPKVFFGIDVMVGLPGESEEMFSETVEFIKKIRPAFIHIFPYSRRSGTVAASMPNQVNEEVKKQRVAVLENLNTKLHRDFLALNTGIKEYVLFEETNHKGIMAGYTGNYIRIERAYDKSLVNTIVEVEIFP